jgi:hypothetical protein
MINEPDTELRSFLSRDYSADVIRLNNNISKSGKGAGLEPWPDGFVQVLVTVRQRSCPRHRARKAGIDLAQRTGGRRGAC